jgi:hypothetical protein
MDSLKFHQGPPCLTLLRLAAISGVACPQGVPPAAVFHPLGHPTPYAYGKRIGKRKQVRSRTEIYFKARNRRKGHGRMAWGGRGLPKVSPRPAMPNPSTPCG